ncbi:MAG: T9SS type A sorting domain-containing protein [Chitinophagaceae bacterium]
MNIKSLLFSSSVFFTLAATAQDAGKTYAITGDGNGDFLWMNIRQVDVSSGKWMQDVYQRDKTAFVLTDAVSKTPVNSAYGNAPTASMVAAAAYDKQHDKLFFTPMRLGELRWLDLSAAGDSRRFYSTGAGSLNTGDLIKDEANQISRMVIGADGNGYALSNDANHLIRFTTGKKTVITDLGNLFDAETNSNISVHNKCTSWGGDIIADAYNKLYLITASHNVFVVDIDTRVATFKGMITGLPATYATNGAAVDADGKVVVSSASSFTGYYRFDINDLKATLMEGSDLKYNASDLANGNLLLQKEADAQKNITTPVPFRAVTPAINADAHVYPNPVTNNEFRVLFDGQPSGNYTISLTDLSGRAILNRSVTIGAKGQVEAVRIPSTLGKGMYMVKLTNTSGQAIFTERIVVQ